ncbi:MAG: hypothetical protein U1B83_01450 [Candidatus Cloacimonadaceae bacterium]|nr:hypothetical protein [Candidatus Cloacimonadaceae bacterium]
MIYFLKSLTFILLNIALGSILLFKLNWFLFNRKARFFLGLKIPLTPGLVARKREWIFNKARDILHDYLDQAESTLNKYGYLAKWEKMVREAAMEKLSFIGEWKFLPHGLKHKIQNSIADIVKDIVSKVLRKTVPHFIQQWRIEHRIDEFDEQFNLEFLYKYWRKYVFKYLFYAFLVVNFLIGLMNMIWYLILLLF